METKTSYKHSDVYQLLKLLDRKLDIFHEDMLNRMEQGFGIKTDDEPELQNEVKVIKAGDIPQNVKEGVVQAHQNINIKPKHHTFLVPLVGQTVSGSSIRSWYNIYFSTRFYNNASRNSIPRNSWIHLYTFDLDADGYNEFVLVKLHVHPQNKIKDNA